MVLEEGWKPLEWYQALATRPSRNHEQYCTAQMACRCEPSRQRSKPMHNPGIGLVTSGIPDSKKVQLTGVGEGETRMEKS